MPDELLAVLASYIAGAFMTLIQWWLETELAWSPERMDTLFRDLVLPGVDHLLNRDHKQSLTTEPSVPKAAHLP